MPYYNVVVLVLTDGEELRVNKSILAGNEGQARNEAATEVMQEFGDSAQIIVNSVTRNNGEDEDLSP